MRRATGRFFQILPNRVVSSGRNRMLLGRLMWGRHLACHRSGKQDACPTMKTAMNAIRKYARTHHLQGSRLQVGDEDLDAVPMSELEGRYVVVEEKMDGANCAASFDCDFALQLQSRGHFLTGGARERQFDLFKQWASATANRLLDVLTDRYVMYGEWMYAKHTIYYDALPHYFMEFDVLDTTTGEFLDTPRRAELLSPEGRIVKIFRLSLVSPPDVVVTGATLPMQIPPAPVSRPGTYATPIPGGLVLQARLD